MQRDWETLKRQAEEGRRRGLNYHEIAAELGINERSARRWLPSAQYPLTAEQEIAAEERRQQRWRQTTNAPVLPAPVPGVLWARRGGKWLEVRVDIEDWEEYRHVRWFLSGTGYAHRCIGGTYVYLHRLILGLESGQGMGRQTDHINRDRLDNRRANLRIVTPTENCANRGGMFERAA